MEGIPPKEVATQVKELTKEYSEKKWIDNPIDKFFAMIKLFFLKRQIGRAGMDLSKEMTPEEMKLAGIAPKEGKKVGEKVPELPKTEKDEERKYQLAKIAFGKLLFSKDKERATALFEQPNFQKLTF